MFQPLRAGLFAVAWAAALSLPASAAQIDDAMAKLAAEAGKVGNIIWYESSPDDAAD